MTSFFLFPGHIYVAVPTLVFRGRDGLRQDFPDWMAAFVWRADERPLICLPSFLISEDNAARRRGKTIIDKCSGLGRVIASLSDVYRLCKGQESICGRALFPVYSNTDGTGNIAVQPRSRAATQPCNRAAHTRHL